MLGWGKGEVRYRTSFFPKNRSGSGDVVSTGTFPAQERKSYLEVHDQDASRSVLIQLKADPASQLTPANHVDTISGSGADAFVYFIQYCSSG